MSIFSNFTGQDLINFCKSAEQQKEQRAPKIKNRILKQTHDVKLTESLSPITKKLVEIVRKSDVEHGNTQTPAIENTTITRSLRDTLAFMKTSKNFFKLVEKDYGKVLWIDVLINPFGENRFSIKNQEFDITPDFQAFFTIAKLTTKFLDNVEKETVFDILKNVGFFDKIPKIVVNSSRMKDALNNLPKMKDKIRNPLLPSIENVEDSSDLEGEGVKIIIP